MKYILKWILIGSLYLTLLVSVVYLAVLNQELWELLMGIVVAIGFGWWLTTKIIGKRIV